MLNLGVESKAQVQFVNNIFVDPNLMALQRVILKPFKTKVDVIGTLVELMPVSYQNVETL